MPSVTDVYGLADEPAERRQLPRSQTSAIEVEGQRPEIGALLGQQAHVAILSENYGYPVAAGSAARADLNGDGWVDYFDYLALTQHWQEGSGCP
jgi:hypothetical protein